MDHPRSHVFHRSLRASYPMAVRGDGAWLYDQNGKGYLDASGGAAVSCLGHSDPDVQAAIIEQVQTLAYAHSGFFTTAPMEALASRLCEEASPALEAVYFVSGGSEAVETALKMARQYFLECGQPNRRHIIARRQSYHGNTLGALAVGGNAWRREPFAPLLMETHHIAPCYEYRNRHQDESPEDYGLRVANELEAKIQQLGPETVCAFVAEPVVGATAGALPAVPGYFRRIREICDQYGILLILDEVMCGMGRTGRLFAYEHDAISPDLLTIAKGLGGGYQPIGAVMVHQKIVSAIRDGSGFLQHGHTYMGHATACAAALAVFEKVSRPEMMVRVQQQGALLRRLLDQRFADHPHVGDIRGRGLFLALELVADRRSKQPFSPGQKVHAAIKSHAMNAGLMCYPMGGTIDGQNGDHVLLAPPFICSDDDIQEIVLRLASAIDAVTLSA